MSTGGEEGKGGDGGLEWRGVEWSDGGGVRECVVIGAA